MVLAFTTVSAVLGQEHVRGMTALFVGLAVGLVGLDQISGQARYTFGVPELLDGIEIVLVAVGLFAVAEVLYFAMYEGREPETQNRMSRVYMSGDDWKRSIPAWLRGTAIGAPFGCIPAGGTEIPTFLSYAVEKKLAKGKNREEFGGAGAIEGVAGPEAANNATVTAAMIPLLTLGIPTSNTTAILLGAFQNYGIQPGPQLFTTSAALVWALIASLYIGNVMLLILNLPLVKLWVQLLKIPKPQLYAGILIFATVGAYGMRQSAFDLVLLWGIGLVGVLMRRFDFPTAPGGGRHDPGPAGRSAAAQRRVDRRGQRQGVPRAPDVASSASARPCGSPTARSSRCASATRARACRATSIAPPERARNAGRPWSCTTASTARSKRCTTSPPPRWPSAATTC
jgi:putative tricarboxylic transport membrane protein